MGRSTDEAGQLVAAYRERDGALEPLRRMLATPGDEFTKDREDRKGNDAAVAAAVDELRPLAKQTKTWFAWAADEARQRGRRADEDDEASLQAALAEVDALRGPARELADQAVAALDVGQRAALGRHLITKLGHADKAWRTHAEEQEAGMPSHHKSRPGNTLTYTPLNKLVEFQLERFRAKYTRLKAASPGDERALPDWQQRPIPRMIILPTRPMKRRWQRLLQPMQVIDARSRDLDEIYQGLERAHAEVRRVEHKAAQQRRQREHEEQARRQAEEADRLTVQAGDLLERDEAHRGEWALSSRLLRQLEWMGLYKQLTEGIRDADDALLVAGIPREQARAVLATLHLAGEYADKAGQRLGELLAGEDALLAKRARLHEAMAGLPVDAETVTKLADLHPELRPAHEWLSQHKDAVIPVLAAQAPEAARALDAALRQLKGGEPSS